MAGKRTTRGKTRTPPGRALVTGASAGIGRELAKVFAEAGSDLGLVARRRHVLEALAAEISSNTGRKAAVLPADLGRAGAAAKIWSELKRRRLEVDVLVNNAGVLEVGEFKAQPLDRVLGLVQINVSALVALTWLATNSMVERGRGRILKVASLASFQPVPAMAVYAASKAFVLSFTESLSEELRGTGVTATALCPGVTDTDMVRRARSVEWELDALPPGLVMDAHAVARAGFAACIKGSVIEVPGLANELVANWVRLQPRWLVRAAGGAISRRWAARRSGR